MKTKKQIVVRVSVVSVVVNTVLAIFKMIAGIVAHSGAMVADAVHSASDMFTSFIVIIGANIGNKKSDKEHPYGHERLESMASMILAIILLGVGLIIGYGGIQKIISGEYHTLQVPGLLALVAAILSIVTKEALYWYTILAARKTGSLSLKADAWHHRSDSLSSIGSFIGILGARIGYPVLDVVASIVISVMIVKVAIDIFRETMNKLVDCSCDAQTVQEMRDVVLAQEGVIEIDEVKTRLFGEKIYVDMEIAVEGTLPLYDAHQIAENVHMQIEAHFPAVKHCMVHVNPYKAEVQTTSALEYEMVEDIQEAAVDVDSVELPAPVSPEAVAPRASALEISEE